MDSAPSTQVAQVVADSVKNAWKPIITTWMGAKDVEEGRRIFVENSIPHYETPEEAVRTYVNMCRYKRHLDQLYETPAELPAHKAPPKDQLRELLRTALQEGRTLLNEEESKNFLVTNGIPVTIAQLAQDPEAAVSIAEKVGYPVVIKGVFPDISHKSDVGGVIIGLPPLNQTLAKMLMQDTKVYKMLQGFRGKPPGRCPYRE